MKLEEILGGINVAEIEGNISKALDMILKMGTSIILKLFLIKTCI